MKHIRTICLAMALFTSLSGFALTATTNGVTWTYSVVNGGARISGGSPTSGTLTIPSRLGGYDVTSIGDEAFRNCSGLTGVTIPNSVKNIGTSAFRASGLRSVAFGGGITNIGNSAFYGCTSLKNIEIPSSVRRIETQAFHSSGLTNVTISSGVERIWPSAFRECSALKNVVIKRGLGYIGNFVFYGCSNLESLTFEGDSPKFGDPCDDVFTGVPSDFCVYVSRDSTGWGVTIPGTWHGVSICYMSYKVRFNANGGTCTTTSLDVERGRSIGTLPVPTRPVGEKATFLGWFTEADGGEEVTAGTIINADTTFYAHWSPVWRYNINNDGTVTFLGYSLSEGDFTIPTEIDGHPVVAIANNAFNNCSGLTSITIPNTVTNIGHYVFHNCSGLTNVTIPDGVVSIGNGLFCNCTNLTSMTIGDGVTRIGDYAFSHCSSLTNITIPNGVTSIGNYAFENCSGLTGMSLGNGVTNIGFCTFSGCTGLTTFEVTEGNSYYKSESGLLLTKDGQTLITMPVNLANVTIPDTVTKIDENAFYEKNGLTDVTLPSSVTNIGRFAFYNCKNLVNVTIPDSVAIIGIRAFYGTPFLANQADGLVVLGKVAYEIKGICPAVVTIPDGVTSIGDSAFIGYYNLTCVTIPESVTTIGDDAFGYCSGLTNVTFYGNAPYMGSNVFRRDESACAYVRGSSTGWGVSIPGSWNGIPIDYIHHSVILEANGGTCEPAILNVAEGLPLTQMPVPTRENAEFLGWYTKQDGGELVDASLIVTNQMTLYAHWLTEVANPVIVSDCGAVFRADSCVVSITSETEGVTIYYTDDGTTPKRYDDYLYTGPITIAETTTFKAVAVVGGLKSGYTTVTVTKHNLTFDEALNVNEGVVLTTGADSPWQPIYDSHAKFGDATARSGVIGNRTDTWLSATVSGAGTMTFWYRVSCEHDEENNLFTCDRLMVYTNDVEITDWRMDGETGWTQRELTFAGGENTVKWVYYKDKSDSAGEDCAWVDGISWTSSGNAGLAAWLAERNLTADAQAANGRMAAECYVLGLDPADATNDFRIVSIELVDGTPKVEWEPKTNRWTGAEIQAELKGAATLDGEWKAVEGATAAEKAAMRFFKVVVEVP